MTLIEVTIVMLIIGILAAIAAPRFSSAMRAAQVRSAAIHTASHVEFVRQSAINGNRSTSLTYDEANSSYQSAEVDFADRIGQLISVDLRQQYDTSIQLQANFDNANTISFDVEGVPIVRNTAMQNGFIEISASGVPSYYVIIAAGTGYVSVLSEADANTNLPTIDPGGISNPAFDPAGNVGALN